MKCYILTEWKNGDEEMELTREKTPEEVWGKSERNLLQAIEVLDQTFADMRAGLIAMLPQSAQEMVPMIVKMSPQEARDFTGKS